MLRILDNMATGKGQEGDVELLEELSEFLQDASLCALGTSASNPVMSAIKHFRDEFDAHVRQKRCPALACVELLHYHIDPDRCDGCHLCHKQCPTEAILGKPKAVHAIDQVTCIKCGNCLMACPEKRSAVLKVAGATPQAAQSG